MSTDTNGAATEAAFAAIVKAFGNESSFGSSAQDAAGNLIEAGQTWLEQSRAIWLRSLDAFDAATAAYVELTRSAAAAVRLANQAMGQAERYAGTAADFASMYSQAARGLLGK